jgi:hypothetical protein
MPLWRCMSLIANNDIQLSGYSTCRESAIRRRGSYFRMHFLSCYQFFWTVLGWTLDIMRISLVPWKNDIYSNSSHSHGLKFMRHEEHCDHSLKFSSDAAKYSGSYLGRQTLSKSPSPPYYLPQLQRPWLELGLCRVHLRSDNPVSHPVVESTSTLMTRQWTRNRTTVQQLIKFTQNPLARARYLASCIFVPM